MTPARATQLARLTSERFDCLVIGGGIVGAGIARDATLRGLKVALVEQGDFASGTSSKTSKLIHGGLRYLEHGHLRLVRESVAERRILRTIAPGLVSPLRLLLPVYRGDARAPWKIHLGLSLYDRLAGHRVLEPHRMIPARHAAELVSGLRTAGLRTAGVYTDCQMDDARLCLANILQAQAGGAACVNYLRVRSLLKAKGLVCGAVVEDGFTTRTWELQARGVVNATGPWADDLRRQAVAAATPRMAPTKGIHLLLPRLAEQALFVQSRRVERMVFLLPWNDLTLVGTTESAPDGPLDALRATADEVGSLLEEVNRLFPDRRLGMDDVITTFAGARPLLAFAGSATRASREHAIEVDSAGLMSVMGGKYTTYRVMAKQVVDLLMQRQGGSAGRCQTAETDLVSPPAARTFDRWRSIMERIAPSQRESLVVRYGQGIWPLLELLEKEPALEAPVCSHHRYLQAELVHAFCTECACTLTDLLARRTRMAWSRCPGLDALPRIIELMQRYGGIPGEQMEQQRLEYQRFLANNRAFQS